MRIAIFGNLFQTEKITPAKRLFETLDLLEAEVIICDEFYHFLTEKMNLNPRYNELITDNNFEADIALSVGGDGTFLKTAERVGAKGIPILGINTGRLGFLADVSGNEIEEVMTEVFKNYYRIEESTLLQVECKAFPENFWPYALNEVAILKRDTSSMISIQTQINDHFLNTYQADGLIIATPTGSTAYSLSVGGPVIEPESSSLAITPVAPHSLNVRPLVICDDVKIELQVDSRSKNFLVSLDGRSTVLQIHNSLTIRKAPFKTKIVKRRNHVFYDTLRNKLMWGADKRS